MLAEAEGPADEQIECVQRMLAKYADFSAVLTAHWFDKEDGELIREAEEAIEAVVQTLKVCSGARVVSVLALLLQFTDGVFVWEAQALGRPPNEVNACAYDCPLI